LAFTVDPLRLGRLPGDIVVERVKSRHTRTLDEPGKASPEHAIREFAKLTRATNAERWPEQLQA
jgi:hypothetical protein